MRIKSRLLGRLHLDAKHLLLSGRNVQVLHFFFSQLDVHGTGLLDDVQFHSFMKESTDLTDDQIFKVFGMFDVDDSGDLEFDEFYLLACMLVAIKDGVEKEFLFRHSRTCFELLDEDASRTISSAEFETFGFLFNFTSKAIKQIFKDFDVSGDSELDYNDFRMFTFACIDKERELKKGASGSHEPGSGGTAAPGDNDGRNGGFECVLL